MQRFALRLSFQISPILCLQRKVILEYCACREKSHLELYQILRLQRKVTLELFLTLLLLLLLDLTLLLLDFTFIVSWLYYYMTLLLLASTFTWLCFYMTLLFFDLVLLSLDSTITWPVQFLGSTITWLYIYLILLLLGSTIAWPVLSLDSTSTWLYYYLTLLLLDSTATWLRDVVRISEVSQPKFPLIPCFFSGPGEEKKQTLYSSDWLPKKLSWTGRFDGRWPAGLPWWLGKRCWLRDRFLGEKFSWRPSTDHDKKQGIPEGSSKTMSFFAGATGILWGFKKGL